ncbi:MucBP domain-containing protein [Fructilactobacillus hinvesii]|uniref:MucBP domain-containing protein n=1 Tax=Fructilactobacillus hinvesii TaxID=2940300 RepID=A0ABY5BQS3_9LACO|nr:MucBP domain-containing protein [Fructilactobacillus hinvesii]USS87458.1 MucBP domain-containing protein [Fructilactobacillus hinvesii]
MASRYRQKFHYTDTEGVGNDTQTMFMGQDGYYHFYFLKNDTDEYNSHSNHWHHIRTKDLNHYEDVGEAITSYNGIWGQVWTGSIIDNSRGFFSDLPKNVTTKVAIFTSPDDNDGGKQKQYMAYSTDDGYSFKPYLDHPVYGLPDGGPINSEGDCRDPHIFYNDKIQSLEVLLAEGDKIGFYVSKDGQRFNYIGCVTINTDKVFLGMIECPNLIRLKDSADGSMHSFLCFGGNPGNGHTMGTYAIEVKENSSVSGGILEPLDGQQFDDHFPSFKMTSWDRITRLDEGSDYYGANFMSLPDPFNSIHDNDDSFNQVIGNAWLGNWETSTVSVKNGDPTLASSGCTSFHIFKVVNGQLEISLVPVIDYDFSQVNHYSGTANQQALKIPKADNLAQILNVSYSNDGKKLTGQISLDAYVDDGDCTLIINFDENYYSIQRKGGSYSNESPRAYSAIYRYPLNLPDPTKLDFDIRTDTQSYELVLNQKRVYSAVRYTLSAAQWYTVYANSNASGMFRITQHLFERPDYGYLHVRYVDQDNQILGNVLSITGKIGDFYSTKQEAFEGYEFTFVLGIPNGVYREGVENVVYHYRKIEPKPVLPTSFQIPDPDNSQPSALKQALDANYLYFGMDVSMATKDNPWASVPVLCKSTNGINFSLIKKFPRLDLRDGFMIKYGDWYYLTGTLDLMRTKDFIHFERIKNGLNQRDDLKFVWASELFADRDHNWHIICTATSAYRNNDIFNGRRFVFIADIDLESGVVSNEWQELDVDCGSDIDASMHYINGRYYLFMSRNHVYVSDSLHGKFIRLSTNLDGNYNAWYEEGPELVQAGGNVYLYYDRIWSNQGQAWNSHYLRRQALNSELTQWSDPVSTVGPFLLRHGSFLYNDLANLNQCEYFPEIDLNSSLGTKVRHG